MACAPPSREHPIICVCFSPSGDRKVLTRTCVTRQVALFAPSGMQASDSFSFQRHFPNVCPHFSFSPRHFLPLSSLFFPILPRVCLTFPVSLFRSTETNRVRLGQVWEMKLRSIHRRKAEQGVAGQCSPRRDYLLDESVHVLSRITATAVTELLRVAVTVAVARIRC